MTSKVTGTNAGKELNGLPPTFSGSRPELEPNFQPSPAQAEHKHDPRDPGRRQGHGTFNLVTAVRTEDVNDLEPVLSRSLDGFHSFLFVLEHTD
jgi:hypothetical protein